MTGTSGRTCEAESVSISGSTIVIKFILFTGRIEYFKSMWRYTEIVFLMMDIQT
jgi:hypothetical protein